MKRNRLFFIIVAVVCIIVGLNLFFSHFFRPENYASMADFGVVVFPDAKYTLNDPEVLEAYHLHGIDYYTSTYSSKTNTYTVHIYGKGLEHAVAEFSSDMVPISYKVQDNLSCSKSLLEFFIIVIGTISIITITVLWLRELIRLIKKLTKKEKS